MPKMTKTQAKRALDSIIQKRNRLFDAGHLNVNDVVAIAKIVERARKRLG